MSSKIKRLFARIFKFRTWSDWDRTTSVYVYLLRLSKILFVPQWSSTQAPEPFDLLLKRLHLSESELHNKRLGLLRAALLALSVAGCFFLYAIYQYYYDHILNFVLSLVLTGIALALTFRYHFWAFQIKQRRLGCAFSEWFNSTIIRKRV